MTATVVVESLIKEIMMKPTISAENLIWMLNQNPTDNLKDMIGEQR